MGYPVLSPHLEQLIHDGATKLAAQIEADGVTEEAIRQLTNQGEISTERNWTEETFRD